MSKSGNINWNIPPAELVLTEHEVHVWLVNQHQHQQIQALWKNLSSDERQRAEQFHFQKDRNQFVMARGVLREIIARYTKVPANHLRFQYSAFGKPCLSEEFCSTPLRFNLSHSCGIVLLGFTIGRELGVDIEQIRSDFATEEIAENFFSTNEVAVLQSLPRSLRTEAFYNAWTRKEAFIKAIGEGLSFPLDKFDVTLSPGEPARLLAIRIEGNFTSKWSMKSLECEQSFKAAIAVEGIDWELKCFQWDGLG
jgi:4'-phosphopantetheinyl transferase